MNNNLNLIFLLLVNISLVSATKHPFSNLPVDAQSKILHEHGLGIRDRFAAFKSSRLFNTMADTDNIPFSKKQAQTIRLYKQNCIDIGAYPIQKDIERQLSIRTYPTERQLECYRFILDNIKMFGPFETIRFQTCHSDLVLSNRTMASLVSLFQTATRRNTSFKTHVTRLVVNHANPYLSPFDNRHSLCQYADIVALFPNLASHGLHSAFPDDETCIEKTITALQDTTRLQELFFSKYSFDTVWLLKKQRGRLAHLVHLKKLKVESFLQPELTRILVEQVKTVKANNMALHISSYFNVGFRDLIALLSMHQLSDIRFDVFLDLASRSLQEFRFALENRKTGLLSLSIRYDAAVRLHLRNVMTNTLVPISRHLSKFKSLRNLNLMLFYNELDIDSFLALESIVANPGLSHLNITLNSMAANIQGSNGSELRFTLLTLFDGISKRPKDEILYLFFDMYDMAWDCDGFTEELGKIIEDALSTGGYLPVQIKLGVTGRWLDIANYANRSEMYSDSD